MLKSSVGFSESIEGLPCGALEGSGKVQPGIGPPVISLFATLTTMRQMRKSYDGMI